VSGLYLELQQRRQGQSNVARNGRGALDSRIWLSRRMGISRRRGNHWKILYFIARCNYRRTVFDIRRRLRFRFYKS